MISSSSSILGHTAQISALTLDLKAGNIAHAYLFEGPAHVGKATVAKWFAGTLLAIGRSPEEQERLPHMIEKLLHPDFLILDKLWMEEQMEDADELAKYSNVSQEHRKKARAKTDTIGIDDVRAIQERLQETGTGKYRICIICDVERMQDEAVNALLKILEEPPAGVVFILTTATFYALLPTLISRSRVLHFSRLPDSVITGMLPRDMSDEDRGFALRISQGAPGMARQLADPETLRKEKQAQSNALAFWYSRSALERLQLLKPLQERGAEADRFLLHLMLAMREERDAVPPAAAERLLELQRHLETNANRQLMVQGFVLSLT